jgi:large subunit ribosomal protein L24
MKIRSDDVVTVISGKDKGKTGKVMRVDTGRSRVWVEGANMVKRHTRPTSVKDTKKANATGIIEKEGPIHVSNVMIVDPRDNKPTRIRIERDAGGNRRRIAKRTGNELD